MKKTKSANEELKEYMKDPKNKRYKELINKRYDRFSMFDVKLTKEDSFYFLLRELTDLWLYSFNKNKTHCYSNLTEYAICSFVEKLKILCDKFVKEKIISENPTMNCEFPETKFFRMKLLLFVLFAHQKPYKKNM